MARQKQRFSGAGYAALFFVLFYIIDRCLESMLFTPEQQKLIKNVGQLLDTEDVLTIFGKPGNHPVYEISKSLAE